MSSNLGTAVSTSGIVSEWSGGRILDPESGKVYKAKMKLNEDGSQLEVRGSVAFFGRSQFWHRVE